MIVSNEPGYYKTGAYGIRIENLVVVDAAPPQPAPSARCCGFETLTLAPIDRACVEPALLDRRELDWLDAYHGRVRQSADAAHRRGGGALARGRDAAAYGLKMPVIARDVIAKSPTFGT